MAIHVEAFPSPSTVSIIERPAVSQSLPGQGLTWTRRRSQVRPRQYELTYVGVIAEVFDALRSHREEHGNAPFRLVAPGIDEQVVWVDGPAAQWQNNRWPTVRVVLERATAVD